MKMGEKGKLEGRKQQMRDAKCARAGRNLVVEVKR